MKKIRGKVFETNSSSSHSISIVEGDEEFYDTIYPDSNGLIALGGMEFGWEWERYTDAVTKATYCAQDCRNDVNKQAMLIEVLQEHTGAIGVEFLDGGYIDHQSHGTTDEAFVSKQTLKDFIFNPKSILFTGNDNSDCYPSFYDPIDAVYDHRLVIEGCDETTLIYKGISEKKFEDAIDFIMCKHPLVQSIYNKKLDTYDCEYYFFPQSYTDSKDKQYSSFAKLNQGLILIFKIQYERDKKHRWFNGVVTEIKEIKCDLIPIDNK